MDLKKNFENYGWLLKTSGMFGYAHHYDDQKSIVCLSMLGHLFFETEIKLAKPNFGNLTRMLKLTE